MTMRAIDQIVPAMPATDGAGVTLKRAVGRPGLEMVDPFLMLDEFGSDDAEAWIAGFPDHPHRGFETVTVMLEGRMRHADSAGHAGTIEAGDVQWMTAGRGIVHSEMPEIADGRLRGFQLWVNLPARDKMVAPRYQEVAAADIPAAVFDGGRARVIAGRFGDVAGPVETGRPVRLLDVTLVPAGVLSVDAAAGRNALAYVAAGAIAGVGRDGGLVEVAAGHTATFAGGTAITLTAGGTGAQVLYAEGAPLDESVARHGPFVMNTRAELMQAFEDFRAGRF